MRRLAIFVCFIAGCGTAEVIEPIASEPAVPSFQPEMVAEPLSPDRRKQAIEAVDAAQERGDTEWLRRWDEAMEQRIEDSLRD